MPALPDVPSVIRIDLIHSVTGDLNIGNRTFWRYTGGAPSNSDLDALASDLASNWTGTLGALTNPDYALVEIVCTDLTSPTSGRGTWSGTHAGTRAGTALSINDVAVLNFQIARRYRGGKPRIYGPWGNEGDLNTLGTWGSGFIANVDTEWTNWTNDLTGAVVGTTTIGAQCNVSYYHSFASVQNPVTLRWRNIPTPRATALVDTLVGHACSAFVGSQRRRIRA